MAIDIFVSVGKAATREQEAFIVAIERRLQRHSFAPRIVGRTEFSSEQPLRLISKLMDECSGSVIIAFERIHIVDGVERRGHPEEKPVQSTNLPTVWNQIEAAMAYAHYHPLLVIVEKGLKNEGLLEAGYDWYVQSVTLSEEALNTAEFQGVFSDWERRVLEFHENRRTRIQTVDATQDPSQLRIGQILRSLTVAQLWALIAAIIGAVGVVAAAAFSLGKLFSGTG